MTEWALAIKRTLGNVYHLSRGDALAAQCDKRIRLEGPTTDSPDDGYICARCLRKKEKENTNPAPAPPKG